MSSISFPYASFDQAEKDGFSKIGGKAEAYRFMVNGFKGGLWRKSANERRQDRVKAAMKLLEEHERKNGSKADRQLGRI